MKKFLVLYHATVSANKQMENANPEDAKKGMDAWMTWAKKCGSGLVDLGAPLGNGQQLSPTASMPSKRNVVGYSVLQADTMDKAKAMLKDHPHLKWNAECEIEVHEMLPLPGSNA